MTTKQGKNKRNPSQNYKAKWAAVGVIATAIFSAISAITASYFGYLQVTTPAKYQATQMAERNSNPNITIHAYEVDVHTQYPFDDTKVLIEKGDDVEIIVQGEDPVWDCGRGPVSPYGYLEKYPDHISPSANACELIGYIGGLDRYIRVGFYKRFIANETGNLFLGINDAKDKFEDNTGKLTVSILVRK